MIEVAVIYHSGFGHTAVQAKAVLEGAAAVSGVSAKLYSVESLSDELTELNTADAMIFGSPTYMGSVSAPFKLFMDNSSKIWLEQKWKDKIAAGFTNSHSLSGDKLNSLIQMCVFAGQHNMIWVMQGEMDHSPDGHPGKPDVINRMGGYLGAMAQSENDSPDVTPPEGDIETARLLGERVATITKRFHAKK